MTIEEEKAVPVFQPFPSLIIKAKQICEDGNVSQLQSYQKNNKIYIAMSMYTCGVIIYDITSLSNPILVYQNTFNDYHNDEEAKTLDITISNDLSYLFIANSQGVVFVLDLNASQIQLISQVQTNNQVQVNSVAEMKDDIYIFLCSKSFQVFTWQKSNLQWVYEQTVTVNALNLVQIQFILDYSYALIVGTNIGVIFYKVSQSPTLQFTQTCILKPYFFYVNQFLLIGQNIIVVMMQFKGVYMYDITNYLSKEGMVCDTYTFQYISQTPSQGQGGMMTISSNQRYLFTQFRSVGVLIYDISKNNFNLVQRLNVEQNSKDVSLCEIPNGIDLLFYSNSDSLQIFKRTTPNFNRDKPNLLLNQYQQVSYSDFKESPTLGSLDYSCIYQEEKQNYFLSRANFGSALFKYRGSGILEYVSFVNRAPSYYPTSYMAFLSDGVRAYASKGAQGLSLINFSNQSQPVVEKFNITLNSPFVQFGKVLLNSDFSYGYISNTVNLLIFELNDPLNPTIVKQIDTLAYLKSPSCDSMMLSHDEKILFVQCYQYGVLSVDISDIQHVQILNKIYTESAFFLRQTLDQKYLLIGTGYKGLIVAEIGKNYEMKQISSVQIQGAVFQILNMWNDNFVLVTSNENPSIQLINLVDKLNPQVIQRIGKQSAFGYYSMCVPKDNSYVIVSSQFELLILQLENQIILHTQVYELISKENSNEYIRKDIAKDQTLKIGQKVEMHLVSIYQSQEIQIKKAQYYQNYVLQDLPYWMEFSSSQSILSLTISKDSLKKDEAGNYIETVQQVVFVTYQSVSGSAFINDYLQINSADSVALKQICITEGILSKDGFVIDSYTPQKVFSLGVNESNYLAKWVSLKTDKKVKNFIQYVINQNIINYTTSFKISNSIYVDLESKSSLIYSLQSDITVQMYVVEPDSYAQKYINSNANIDSSHFLISEKAKFVKKNYSGILLLLSEKQNELKIEGSLSNVNNILSQGIKFSVVSENDYSIYIRIVIADGVNYNYEKIVHYKQVNFISMQSQVLLSEQNGLRNDFGSKYPGGDIYIQSNFQYQVSQKVFTCKDEKQLMYTAQLFVNGEFQEIPKDFWLQYSFTDRIFSGIPPATEFQKQYFVQINATDGYTYAVDSFQITPCLIPFSYALQFAIQIIGPIFGIFGFWKYKHIMYNVAFKKHYVYSKETIYVGEMYKKQIPSSNDRRENSVQLWKFFLNHFTSSFFYEQIEQELTQERAMKVMKIEDFLKEQDKESFSQMIFQKMYPFGVSDRDLAYFNNREQNQINKSMRMTQQNELSNQQQQVANGQDTDRVIHLQSVCMDNQISNSNRQHQASTFNLNNQKSSQVQQHQSPQLDSNQFNNVILSSFQSINSGQPDQKQSTIQLSKIQNQADQSKNKNLSSNVGSPSYFNNNGNNNNQNIHKNSKQTRISYQKDKESKKIAKFINIKAKNKLRESHSPKFKANKIANQISIFTEEGSINFVEINKFIYEKQKQVIEKKRLVSDLELKNLLNPNSMLFQAVASLASEYFLNLNNLSKQIFNQLQLKAIKYYREIDWYKAYLIIEPNFQNININLYPNISIDHKTFYPAIREICEQINYFLMEQNLSSPGVQSNNYKSNQDKQDPLQIAKSIHYMHTAFSIELIEQAIKARAYGFSMQSLQVLQKTRGETMHTYSHSIHSIKAFEKNNEIKCCFNLLKFLDMHYIEKGLTDNDRLPSWIQSVDLIHGVILLCGIPEKKDVGSVIFKVFDEDMFIVRSFEVKIIEKENNNTNDNQIQMINSQDVQNQSDSSLLYSLKQKKKISEIINAPSNKQQQSSPQQSQSNSPMVNQNVNTFQAINNKEEDKVQNKRQNYSLKKCKSSFAPDQQLNHHNQSNQQQNQEIYSQRVNKESQQPSILEKELTLSQSVSLSQNKYQQNKIFDLSQSSPQNKEGQKTPSLSLDQNYIEKNIQMPKQNDSIKGVKESTSLQINNNLIYSQESQIKAQNLSKGLNSEQQNQNKFGKIPQQNVNKLIQSDFSENNELNQVQARNKNNNKNYQDQSKLIEHDPPQSMNTSFNPNSQTIDITSRYLMQEQTQLDDKGDISMNFNITERFQSNIGKQEMKDGEDNDLQLSSFIL